MKDMEDAIFPECFVTNIEVIMRYTQEDVISVLDQRKSEVVFSVRKTLCDKVKEVFPDLSEKQPINRRATSRHLVYQDILTMANVINMGNKKWEVDKIFSLDTQDRDAETSASDALDVNDPVAVAEQVKILMDELSRLKAIVEDLPPACSCRCKSDRTKNATAGVVTVSSGAETPIQPVVRENPSTSDDSSRASATSSDDEDGFQLPTQTKKKRRHHKRKKEAAASMVVAAVSASYGAKKDLYVGNVNPKCGEQDMRRHLANNGITVEIKDIVKLHKGNDYSSFRISLPPKNYNAVMTPPGSRMWTKDLKVRPYHIKGQGQQKRVTQRTHAKRNHQGPNNFVSAGRDDTKSHSTQATSPATENHHGLRVASFQAGYELALQDARHRSWSTIAQHPIQNIGSQWPELSHTRTQYNDPRLFRPQPY